MNPVLMKKKSIVRNISNVSNNQLPRYRDNRTRNLGAQFGTDNREINDIHQPNFNNNNFQAEFADNSASSSCNDCRKRPKRCYTCQGSFNEPAFNSVQELYLFHPINNEQATSTVNLKYVPLIVPEGNHIKAITELGTDITVSLDFPCVKCNCIVECIFYTENDIITQVQEFNKVKKAQAEFKNVDNADFGNIKISYDRICCEC